MAVTVPMKFALESLPDLIGAEDFKDLCLLLGWHEVHEEPMTGADFAHCVREAAFKRRHADRSMLEGLRQATVRGSSPAKIREQFEAAVAELATDQPPSGA